MHERALELVTQMLAEGGGHAFLVTGPRGVGKRALAEAVAAHVFGCAPSELARQPNLVRLGRPIDEKTGQPKKTIPVELVERLVGSLALSSLGNAPKLALIDDADALNDHGQNALLKTIEEPRGRVTLVLLAESPERILPTIRSRVVHVPLFASADAVLAHSSDDLDARVAAFVAAPRWQRLVQAAALTKGDDAATGDALLMFYQRLALVLHRDLLAKCGTMRTDECRAKARALALLADAPGAIAGNASQTLFLEAIALALP